MDEITYYMQNMDYMPLLLICASTVAVVCGLLLITKTKNDTMQRNSGKVREKSSKCYNSQNYTLNSSIFSNSNHQNFNSTIGKQRILRSSNKSQDVKIRRTSEFKIKNWLRNDMYCYERQFMSSCVKDVMASCHNSDAAARNDDSNFSSSNEELCSTYSLKPNLHKKSIKSRQKKQQKRKTHPTYNIDDDLNENVKPNGLKPKSSCAALNLRKQCTKAAAIKSVLNNSKLLNDLSTIEFKSSVPCTLSSASSTTSINSSVSSSASSSPLHSVNSSPTSSPTLCKRNTEYLKKSAKSFNSPLRQFTKLNMNEQQFAQQMKRYVIDQDLLRVYGFPVESIQDDSHIEIYKCLPKHLAEEAVTKDNQRHHRHFYGSKKCGVINKSDGLNSSAYYSNSSVQSDSGCGSGASSPRSTDSDSSEMCEEDTNIPLMAFYTPDGVFQIFSEYSNSIEKQCARCSKMFIVNEEGEYLSFDSCTYHWGKLTNVYNGKGYINIYSCCQGNELSEGCSQHSLHVWNGVVVGINGPYIDFVHTQHKQTKQKHPKVYAIDCEMSYTGMGLEVTKVTVVSYDGSLVYEHFVKPQAKIIDYNTRFSGVSEKDFAADSNHSIKTFTEVQEDLLNLFDADTILIGHGLDNDLRVLRLVHKTIVDTSLIFSHSTGYPYRRSLKNLTKSFLKRDIQGGDMGHSSFEDSRACLELMIWKVRKDLRYWN